MTEHHAAQHGPRSFWTRYVFSTDHKVIALQFTLSSLLFVVIGGLLALGVRYQLAWPWQDVPYHKLLPGGTLPEDTDGPRMTRRVPESNPASWSVGAEVRVVKDLKLLGQHVPKDAVATLVGFPRGIAVTLPAGLVVEENGRQRRLSRLVEGFIDPDQVIADYDYTQVPVQVRTAPGVTVRRAGSERRLTLRGREIERPDGRVETLTDRITLPVRRYVVVRFAAGTGTLEQSNGARTRLREPATAIVADPGALQDCDFVSGRALLPPGTMVTMTGPPQQAGKVGGGAGEPVEIVAGPTLVALDVPRQKVGADPDAEVGGPGGKTIGPEQVGLAPASYVAAHKHQLTPEGYLSLFTMHASIMIFFVIIPMLVGGFGNFLIPLMVGARDMAFPRLNMLSFWIALPTSLLMLASFWVSGGSAGGGWTMYPPLSDAYTTSAIGTNIWVFAVAIVGFSSIVGALNYITTIINMRAPGMALFRMPLTVWSLFITAILQLFATPVLTAVMIMLLLDRTLGTTFFAPVAEQVIAGAGEQATTLATARGGQPLLFQHLFWFYSHPAVYIMILPAMGVASDVIATHARKPIFGYRPMVYAISAIAGLGFVVWGHHMFMSGMNPMLGTTFMASTIMIAVPSAIKVFNWLGTLWGGDIRFTPAMLHAVGFVSMFVIGGLSGIFMASTPVDIPIHDTYFIVAHIHYVLFGGSIFGIFAGIYHWYPKMFGTHMNARWGVIHFVLTIIAFNGTFFLMHVLGVGGHPRRYASIMEFPLLQHLQPMNVIMTLWAMALGMAQIPFFYNFFASMPRRAGRGLIALFAAALVATTVIGHSYWSGATWEVADGVSRMLTTGYGSYANLLGHVFAVAALIALLVMLVKGLPIGGRIAAVLLLVPAIVLSILVSRWASSGGLTTTAWQATHNLQVAFGHGVIASIVVVIAVFLIWAVGGALRMPALLQRLLYIVTLPAFLSPLVLKEDLYILRGMTGLMDARYLILILLALPGLLYLVIRRPRDAFGAPAETNPWHANSLEWAAPSPPPHENFETIPTVYRGPYEYSPPDVEADFLPQSEPGA